MAVSNNNNNSNSNSNSNDNSNGNGNGDSKTPRRAFEWDLRFEKSIVSCIIISSIITITIVVTGIIIVPEPPIAFQALNLEDHWLHFRRLLDCLSRAAHLFRHDRLSTHLRMHCSCVHGQLLDAPARKQRLRLFA